MDAQDKNALACHQNALITHDEQAPLCPLHDIRTGLPIANFPPTERALKELDGQDDILQSIMTALGYQYNTWSVTRAKEAYELLLIIHQYKATPIAMEWVLIINPGL
ncbi:MAG: hypothetical protein MMC33_010326 [Icmadophila ericetorum]|nr:hypothetical protein [Icmadophila ericetorum]